MTRTPSNPALRLLLFFALFSTQFHASALICKNGVTAILDGNGQLTLPAEQFVLDNNSCCSVGISYEISRDNGINYNPTASFDCDDLGLYPVQLKFNDCLGVSNYCETFIIIQDNFLYCENGCNGCCYPNLLVRPMTVALHDNHTAKVNASWFDDGSFSTCATGTLRFSFSSNINDTLITLSCNEIGQQALQIWATDTAGYQAFAETFIIVQEVINNCIGPGPCLPSPVAHNGIIISLLPTGEFFVPIRLFNLASHTGSCNMAASYSFSTTGNLADTLLHFTCDDLGQQAIRFYIHDDLGNVNYIETFVIVEDMSNYCSNPPNLVPPNDDVCNAYDINYLLNTDCNEKFFNIGGTADNNEVTPPLGACGDPNTWCDTAVVAEKTVWFKFEVTDYGQATIITTGMNTQLALWNAASCEDIKAGNAVLVAANDDDPLLPDGGSKLVAECLAIGKTYYLQMDGFNNSEDYFGLNFTSTGPPCDLATSEGKFVENGFTILPNPASDVVKLQLLQATTSWLGGKVVLTDISGMVIMEQIITNERMVLDINETPTGIYFLHLQFGNLATSMHKLAIFK
ncbi:MAG: T9SS type A sorting domain-containing protein [Bacteroidetes bacterium]|nr:T9SS type A sorting domain-containing protein [Bacteroidota bacterium]